MEMKMKTAGGDFGVVVCLITTMEFIPALASHVKYYMTERAVGLIASIALPTAVFLFGLVLILGMGIALEYGKPPPWRSKYSK